MINFLTTTSGTFVKNAGMEIASVGKNTMVEREMVLLLWFVVVVKIIINIGCMF